MAVMNLEYIKKMVNIFADTHMPFKYLMEPVIRGYNQLSEEEQKEFCSWLAGPNPQRGRKLKEYPRGLRKTAGILDDNCDITPEEVEEVLKDYEQHRTSN